MSTPADLPDRARVVVVGGGVIGASVAYHLAVEGERDVLLLERDRLTSGTTWHAAGLMTTFGSLSHTSTAMRLYSRDLYARLEAETGLSTGFRPVGLVEVAADAERLEEYRRVAAFQRLHGLEVEEIGPSEVASLFPLARTDDLLGGFHAPGDGRVDPVDLTMSLARGARQRGVQVVEATTVTGIRTTRSGVIQRVSGVTTSRGEIECESLVVCAGMWTRELMAGLGVVVPNQAAEHYYLITDTIEGIDPQGPVLEDPASYGYYREEGGGLMVGLFEPTAAPWALDGIPATSSFRTLPPDWERMTPFLETAMARVPVSQEAGIRTLFCGPESFTPDLAPVVGEAPGVAGCFVLAGLNSIGVLSAGGLGRIVAHWVVSGSPDVDVTAFAATRTRPEQAGRAHRAARTTEVLGTVFAPHTPGAVLTSARGVRRSPLHDALAAEGAWFRDVSGWESPDWYAGNGASPAPVPTWRRAPWFAHWEAEHRAVREGVGLVDMSFMTKLWVEGRDAGAVLSRVSAGDVDGACGVITYTPWLDEAGRVMADLTVTKLAPDRFLVVAGDTASGSTIDWLRRHIGQAHAHVFDGTSGLAQLNLHGPRAREVLQRATSVDLSNDAFPFRAARWIDLGLARALAVRIGYVGELGWELHVPTEMAPHVYATLLGAAQPSGLRHVGLKALGSLRLEKAYRDYGHDIDNTDDVVSAGLGFAVAADKPGGFVGREAVLALRAAGPPPRRLVQVLVTDPEPLLFHAEPVLRDGIPVGYVRAGSYGWTLGGAVGLAMVEAGAGLPVSTQWLDTGTWQVDIAGHLHDATVSLRPRYDPGSARIHA